MKIVGLVDYHSTKTTNSCISSVREAGPDVVLVVVDNGGDYRPPDPGVRVLRPPQNVGFAGGCNLLLQFAREQQASWLWLLNNDCTVRRDSVRVMETLNDKVEADVYTSITLLGDSDRIWYGGGRTGRFSFRQRHRLYGAVYRTPSRDFWFTQWASGANLFVPQRTLDACQDFDEHLFLYLEELEWQRRQELTVAISTEPLVRHYPGTTTRRFGDNLEHFFSARNAWLLGQRQWSLPRLYFSALWFLDYILKPVLKGNIGGARTGIYGWRARSFPGAEALEYYASKRRR